MLRDITEGPHLHRRGSLQPRIHISTFPVYIYFFTFSFFYLLCLHSSFYFHLSIPSSFLFVYLLLIPPILFSSLRLCLCYAFLIKYSAQTLLHYLAKEQGQWRRIKPV